MIYFIGPNKLCHYIILLCLDKRFMWSDHGVGGGSLGHQGQFHVLKVSKNPWQWSIKSSVARDAWYSTRILQFPKCLNSGWEKNVFCIVLPNPDNETYMGRPSDLECSYHRPHPHDFLTLVESHPAYHSLKASPHKSGLHLTINFLLSKRFWETNDVFLSNCNTRLLP